MAKQILHPPPPESGQSVIAPEVETEETNEDEETE